MPPRPKLDSDLRVVFFRATFPHCKEEEVLAYVKRHVGTGERYYVVEEGGTGDVKRHWHIAMLVSKCDEAMRKDKHKLFVGDVTGQEAFCKTPEDKKKGARGMYVYMSKGEAHGKGPKIVLNTMFTEEQVKEMHDEYWSVNDALKKNTAKGGAYMIDALIEQCHINPHMDRHAIRYKIYERALETRNTHMMFTAGKTAWMVWITVQVNSGKLTKEEAFRIFDAHV